MIAQRTEVGYGSQTAVGRARTGVRSAPLSADMTTASAVFGLGARSCPSSTIFLIERYDRQFCQPWATEMTRRQVLIVVALVVTPLAAAAAAPWLIYWFGLSQVEGRPTAGPFVRVNLNRRMGIADPSA